MRACVKIPASKCAARNLTSGRPPDTPAAGLRALDSPGSSRQRVGRIRACAGIRVVHFLPMAASDVSAGFSRHPDHAFPFRGFSIRDKSKSTEPKPLSES